LGDGRKLKVKGQEKIVQTYCKEKGSKCTQFSLKTEQDNNCLFKRINVRPSGPAGICSRTLNEWAEPISSKFSFFLRTSESWKRFWMTGKD